MLKKTIAFILTLATIVSILTSCTLRKDTDVSSSDDSDTSSGTADTVSHSSKATSSKAEASKVVSEESSLSSEEIAAEVNSYLDIILADVNEHNFSTTESDLAKEFPNEFSLMIFNR